MQAIYRYGGEIVKTPEAIAVELTQPIPLELPNVAGWKEVPLIENQEPLVALGAFSEYDDIFTSSVYAGEHSNSPYWSADRHLQGAITAQFVRSEVGEQLRSAQGLLPKNHYLIVLDSYRTLQVQGALYDHYLKVLTRQNPEWSAEELSRETQRYVSIPSSDPSKPSPHNTGGAVDLAIFTLPAEQTDLLGKTDERITQLRRQAPTEFTPEDEARDPILRELYLQEMTKQSILRRYGQFLNFGTAFDHGGEAAAANYLERLATERDLNDVEQEALLNRRLLYNAMQAVGMQPYADEWWHFNSPKSQMGAKVAGLNQAEYGAMELSPENQVHETMRSMHRQGLVRLQETALYGFRKPLPPGVLGELVALNQQALERVGDPRIGLELGKVEVIEPPDRAA